MSASVYIRVNKVLVALSAAKDRYWLKFLQPENRHWIRLLGRLGLFLVGLTLSHGYLLRRYIRIHEVTNLEAASYVSQGTLLLVPTGGGFDRQSQSGKVLDSWLRSEQMLNVLFERRNLFGVALNRLPQASPDLTAATLAQNVAIVPVFSSGEAVVTEQTLLEGQLQGRQYKGEVYTPSRVLLLKVKAVGESPKTSQSFAEATMGALQEILVEVATETAARQKQQLEIQYQQLTRNIKKAKSQSKSETLTSPEIFATEEKISVLEYERRALVAQVADLKARAAQPVVVSFSDDGTDRAYVEKSVSLARAELIYFKDSREVKRLRAVKEREDLMRKLALQAAQEAQRQKMIAEAEVKSRTAAEYERQILELRRTLPKLKEQQTEQERQRSLRLWEDELFSVENQLMTTRLELSQAESEGASVVLHPPLPGTVNRPVLEQATSRYYRALVLLPLSCIVGLSLVLIFETLRWLTQPTRQVEEMIDAPVVCHLPPLPLGQCRSWDRLKQ